MTEVINHKAQLQSYFDGPGFERWSAIYGDAPVSRVRRAVREGHAQMLAQAEAWLAEALDGTRGQRPMVLDAGCGTGLLSIALARRGFAVAAVDIAPQMVAAAETKAQLSGVASDIRFWATDLEAINIRFDAVACLDVLVHYPLPSFARTCTHLARCSNGSFVFTYAPHSPLLAALHWVGGRFPRSDRRTEIRMIPEHEVRAALMAAGMRIRRSVRVGRGVYHVQLVEAVAAS